MHAAEPEQFGEHTSGDDSLPYYPGISSNYFDTGIPRFEVFDDNYD